MKIDVAVLQLIFSAAGFLGLLGAGWGAFVKLSAKVEHQEETLKRIEEAQKQHAQDDKERFTEIGVLIKAGDAASALIRENQLEMRLDLRELQKFRDRVERRNGPQPGAGA